MKKHRIAVALLSGGIDSTTCLYHAVNASPAYDEKHAVSINYGQRHLKETDYAKETCKYLGIEHHMLDVPNILPSSMLTDTNVKVPDISYAEIEGVSPTYVPFRNGTMLSMVTAFAEGLRMNAQKTIKQANGTLKGIEGIEADIYFGAHAEDAANWAYPDCTPEFIGAMANAIYIGSYMGVRLVTPLQWLDKKAIIKHGHELNVSWERTWSCYKGETFQCGTCPTCLSRRQGFAEAGVYDPTPYKIDLPNYKEALKTGIYTEEQIEAKLAAAKPNTSEVDEILATIVAESTVEELRDAKVFASPESAAAAKGEEFFARPTGGVAGDDEVPF